MSQVQDGFVILFVVKRLTLSTNAAWKSCGCKRVLFQSWGHCMVAIGSRFDGRHSVAHIVRGRTSTQICAACIQESILEACGAAPTVREALCRSRKGS